MTNMKKYDSVKLKIALQKKSEKKLLQLSERKQSELLAKKYGYLMKRKAA